MAELTFWCQKCGGKLVVVTEAEVELYGLHRLDPAGAPVCRCGARSWMNLRPWTLSSLDRRFLRQLRIAPDEPVPAPRSE